MRHTVEADAIPGTVGAYALSIELTQPVSVIRFPAVTLPAGNYVYCGSAYGPGGLRARIARHLRHRKTIRWHVDYLTRCGIVRTVLALPGGSECALLSSVLACPDTDVPIPGFGSSDCRRCESHLAAVPKEFDLAGITVKALK